MKRIVSAVLALGIALACLLPFSAWGVEAAAAIVIEGETGTVLFAQNADVRLPMASTTKIMTALLTLEAPDLDRPFVVDSTAIKVEGSSMGLTLGDTVTLRSLAGGMLTASGNDAANAAAVAIAGSPAAFVSMMNCRAEALGMKNTHFVTPSGLDSEEHYSTAADMALLARSALKNPLFAEMCGSKKLTLFFGSPPYRRNLYNHNRLLELYPPAVGIKTGFTKGAGRCLVSAARRDGVTLIAVTLRCSDDWNVHRSLYEEYFPAVKLVEPPPPNAFSLPVVGGTVSGILPVLADSAALPAINGKPLDCTFKIFAPNFLYAPIKKGDIVGKIVYYIDNEPLREVPLAAAGDCPALPPMKKSFFRRLREEVYNRLFEAE